MTIGHAIACIGIEYCMLGAVIAAAARHKSGAPWVVCAGFGLLWFLLIPEIFRRK